MADRITIDFERINDATHVGFNTLFMENLDLSAAQVERLCVELAKNATIEKLIMTHVRSESGSAVGKALETNSTLKNVTIYHCEVSDDGMRALSNGLAMNRSVTKFKINNMVTLTAAPHLGDALGRNTTLRSFDMSYCNITHTRTLAVLQGMRTNETLEEMYLAATDVDDACGVELGAWMKRNRALRILDLSHNDRRAEKGLLAIVEGLKGHPSIETLDVSFAPVGNAVMSALSKGLAGDIRLKNLKAIATEMSHGTKELGNALKTNTTLETLELGLFSHSARAVARILEGVRDNTTLRTLILIEERERREGNATFESMRDALAHNRGLLRFQYDMHRFDRNEARALAEGIAANGSLKIVNLTWEEGPENGGTFAAFWDTLRRNTTLRAFTLRAPRFGDEDVRALCESAVANGKLTTFGVNSYLVPFSSAAWTHMADVIRRCDTLENVEASRRAELGSPGRTAAFEAVAERIVSRVRLTVDEGPVATIFPGWLSRSEVQVAMERLMVRLIVDTAPRVPSALNAHGDRFKEILSKYLGPRDDDEEDV